MRSKFTASQTIDGIVLAHSVKTDDWLMFNTFVRTLTGDRDFIEVICESVTC